MMLDFNHKYNKRNPAKIKGLLFKKDILRIIKSSDLNIYTNRIYRKSIRSNKLGILHDQYLTFFKNFFFGNIKNE
jgi:hypothetical protein